MLQYGKQTIEDEDIQAVVEVLRENQYLTTGPRVAQFEDKVATMSGYKYGVAVANGTAALHCAAFAIDIKEDDEVIVPGISFIASSNCIVYQGGTPVFCDIEEETMNINPDKIEPLITDKTKAIVCVDFAGQLCDYKKIRAIADKYNLHIIEDAAHSLGKLEANCADLVTLSFHPVKNITTGEGGMVLTNNEEFYKRMRMFRNHGIDMDYKNRKLHYYDMIGLGYNYRITDFQCALGLSQLSRLDIWITRRNDIAAIYNKAFKDLKTIEPLKLNFPCAYHIYIIKLNLDKLQHDRDYYFQKLRELGVGTNVHYSPIYLHSFYRGRFGYPEGLCPVVEDVYKRIITLPLFPTMTDENIEKVILSIRELFS